MQPECDDYRKKIAKSILGDLSEAETRALEQHLASCPQCQSEKESYARTLGMIQSIDDEPVPRHFFIQPEEQTVNPWALFRLLKPRWQAITAAFAGLFLLAGIGGILGYSRGRIDVAGLKKDFLQAAEEQSRRTTITYMQEVRAEIARSRTDLTQQQRAELTAALDRIDSRMNGRINQAENRVRNDALNMAANVYQAVSQQRAQDLNLINLRFDGIETKSAIETRQTDAILTTLLQVAELKLK
jgi:anti-sigma factor RsiW